MQVPFDTVYSDFVDSFFELAYNTIGYPVTENATGKVRHLTGNEMSSAIANFIVYQIVDECRAAARTEANWWEHLRLTLETLDSFHETEGGNG